MSNAALNWWVKLDIDATAKHVGMVMANRVKDHEFIYNKPLAELKDETSRDRSTLIWCLRYLVECGLIQAVTQKAGAAAEYLMNVGAEPKADVPRTRRTVQPVVPCNPLQDATPTRRTVPPLPVVPYDPPLASPYKENHKKPLKQPKELSDARHQAFIAWLFEQHPGIVLQPVDFKSLKTLLAATRESPLYTQERLREHWARFINSPDKFVQKQGLSLKYFCLNISQFAKESGYGHKQQENPNTRAARDFVSRELAKTLQPDLSDVREDARRTGPHDGVPRRISH